ncbi:sterol desaturase family protein [Rapidithrix thailandica]|uniref:Sterol desaturase family protein n=1 Tax=Rapidithrix thailandica TaxID=413964 RepID=A0AAW9S4J2_9BACT
MDLNPVILSIPVYFILIGFELIVTFLRKTDYYHLPDAMTNISCGIGDQVIGIFAKVVTLGVYQYIFEHFRLFDIPNNWLWFAVLFVAVDFIYYWVHRLSHEVNFLWAGHVVHHQSEDYNFSVALRQSWFHKFFTFAFYLPLAFIGFDTLSFLAANGFNLLYQFWIHTELIGKMGAFEKVMNTPSHHRVHHGRNPEYIDKNHAGVFIIWDRIFGTFQEEKEKPVYGVTTPLNSWNPLWANVIHWKSMWQQAYSFPTWKDRWKLFFKPPGWQPDYLGGPLQVPEVERLSVEKFTSFTPLQLNLYLVFQYVLVLAGTAFFLFGHESMTVLDKSLGALLIGWAVIHCGLLFERKKWVYVLEYFRLVGSLLYLMYMIRGFHYFEPVVFAASGLTLLSLLGLVLLFKVFK